MDDREAVKNYIQDNYDVYPGYYVWRKDYFMEYSWIHWACQEILYTLALTKDDEMDVKDIILDYIKDTQFCLDVAKSNTSKIMFRTAMNIAEEIYLLIGG